MKYSALVTAESGRKVTIENQEYTSKKKFISDLRQNGYKVNPKKVKPAELFDYIYNHTNMAAWDWELKAIPTESDTTTDENKEDNMNTTYKIQENQNFNSREVYFDGKPEASTREALKALKMRWNPKKRAGTDTPPKTLLWPPFWGATKAPKLPLML